jgi:hypothetical protein
MGDRSRQQSLLTVAAIAIGATKFSVDCVKHKLRYSYIPTGARSIATPPRTSRHLFVFPPGWTGTGPSFDEGGNVPLGQKRQGYESVLIHVSFVLIRAYVTLYPMLFLAQANSGFAGGVVVDGGGKLQGRPWKGAKQALSSHMSGAQNPLSCFIYSK